jgi:predicted CXXCH cytochrome family protein
VAHVEFVCSTCHVFQAQLFDTSPHKPAFAAMGLATCITCHSNHRITKPSDAMIGTGKDAVCLNCHSDGDAGFAGAQKMRAALDDLSAAIARADRALEVAENSGMEISQAKLDHIQARDALTKARVTIHSFQPDKVNADIKPGLDVAARSLKAGEEALVERDFRRLGLGISLLTIVAVVAGLALYIRQMDAAANSG